MTSEEEQGIYLALEQHNRIRRVRVGLPPQDFQRLLMAIDEKLPILEYLIIATGTEDGFTFVLPKTL